MSGEDVVCIMSRESLPKRLECRQLVTFAIELSSQMEIELLRTEGGVGPERQLTHEAPGVDYLPVVRLKSA
jgi:hypothetical protein